MENIEKMPEKYKFYDKYLTTSVPERRKKSVWYRSKLTLFLLVLEVFLGFFLVQNYFYKVFKMFSSWYRMLLDIFYLAKAVVLKVFALKIQEYLKNYLFS